MAFGNLKVKAAAEPAAAAAEPAAAAAAAAEKKEGGWNNMWGAIAAAEGIVEQINPNIYGEIVPDGCAMMMKNLPEVSRLTPDSVVYDLGSGYGRFAVWCSVVCKVKGVGIENNPARAASAAQAKELCVKGGLLDEEEAARVVLSEGDAFAPGAFEDATHIYLCNVGYSEDMHEAMLKEVPNCPKLKCVMTITALHDGPCKVPDGALAAAGLEYSGDTIAPTTWDSNSKVHYYTTTLGRAPAPIKLKLADAEKFSAIVQQVYSQVAQDEG